MCMDIAMPRLKCYSDPLYFYGNIYHPRISKTDVYRIYKPIQPIKNITRIGIFKA